MATRRERRRSTYYAGKRPISSLVTALSSIDAIHEVSAVDDATELDERPVRYSGVTIGQLSSRTFAGDEPLSLNGIGEPREESSRVVEAVGERSPYPS